MTATELDVDRTLELARSAREPSAVDEQRVLDALRSRIVDTPELLGGRRVRRLQLVETRRLRRVSTSVEEGPRAEGPIRAGFDAPLTAQRGCGEAGSNLGHEGLVRVLGEGAPTQKDEAPPPRLRR